MLKSEAMELVYYGIWHVSHTLIEVVEIQQGLIEEPQYVIKII